MLHVIRFVVFLDTLGICCTNLTGHSPHSELLSKFGILQIIDEKSLIKKYQREISSLKQELDQLRRGMLVGVNHEELISLRQQVSLFALKYAYIMALVVLSDSFMMINHIFH